MMGLRETLKLVHRLLESEGVAHALIGGLALASYGSLRATVDLDLIVDENDRDSVLRILLKNGFELFNDGPEVIQFSGLGFVDILLARRPISRQLLAEAEVIGPEGILIIGPEGLIGLKIQAYVNDPARELQDKADIQFLIGNVEDLDWNKVWTFADLFNQRTAIDEIKKKAGL